MDIMAFAVKKAKQAPSKFKVSAIGLDYKGNYLGSAYSSTRFLRYGGGLHAEMALLHRYGDKVKTMIICRVGQSGEIRPIEPCERCQKILDKMNIKVYCIKEK